MKHRVASVLVFANPDHVLVQLPLLRSEKVAMPAAPGGQNTGAEVKEAEAK
jgi:hypothetical protein